MPEGLQPSSPAISYITHWPTLRPAWRHNSPSNGPFFWLIAFIIFTYTTPEVHVKNTLDIELVYRIGWAGLGKCSSFGRFNSLPPILYKKLFECLTCIWLCIHTQAHRLYSCRSYFSTFRYKTKLTLELSTSSFSIVLGHWNTNLPIIAFPVRALGAEKIRVLTTQTRLETLNKFCMQAELTHAPSTYANINHFQHFPIQLGHH